MKSQKAIKYVVMKNSKKVLEGTMSKNVRTNKPVLDAARQALAIKLGDKKPSVHRITVFRGEEKSGEWSCNPAKLKKKKAA